MKIIVDNKIPYLKTVLETYAEVEYYPAKEITASVVKEADAIVIRTRTKCNADILEGSKVKMITTATIGFDHIDTDYCDANGIKWANAPGCNSTSVMQYIASALAYLSSKYKFPLLSVTGSAVPKAKLLNESSESPLIAKSFIGDISKFLFSGTFLFL